MIIVLVLVSFILIMFYNILCVDSGTVVVRVPVPVPVRVAVPVNIPTQRIESYRQVGYLYNEEGGNKIMLPIFGRQLHMNSTRWNYYTSSDNHNYSIHIPLYNKGRDCESEYGCEELYNDDEISIPEYSNTFRVKLYRNHLKYIPFLGQ